MPKIGDIRPYRDSRDGQKGCPKAIWQACSSCGKERWVRLVRDKPENELCLPCFNRITKPKPRPLPGEPKLGDIIRKGSSGYRIWKNCADCGKPRWTSLYSNNLRCPRCANIANRTHKQFNPTPPQLGEVRRYDEIGKRRTSMRYYIWNACRVCGKPRWSVVKKDGQPETTRCKACFIKEYRGDKCAAWKGGTRSTTQGYVLVRLEPTDFFYPMTSKNAGRKGFTLEHRLVMAKHLGRCLQTWERVHHKNGNKADNRVENLEIVTPEAHITLHNKGYRDGFDRGVQDGGNALIDSLSMQVYRLKLEVFWHESIKDIAPNTKDVFVETMSDIETRQLCSDALKELLRREVVVIQPRLIAGAMGDRE